MQGSTLRVTSDAAIERARGALAAGDAAMAEQLCRAVAAADPHDAWPWTMLSEIALRRGDGAAGLAHASEAVRLAPHMLLAHVMLAKAHLQRGDQVAALAAAATGERVRNAPAEALDGLGAVLGLLGQHQRALALFRRAVALQPRSPQPLFNLAATERMIGALDSAETHCDAALAADPHFGLAYYLRSDLRQQTPARNHLAEMEGLLARGARTPQDEVLVRFALAKEYEDLGEHARSFAQVKAGADRHRHQTPYDPRHDLGMIDRVMHTQTASWLKSVRAGYRDTAPIFVVGLPRSGTTVVERIIAGHSLVSSAGEIGLFPGEVSRALGEVRRRAGGPLPAAAGDLDVAALGKRYVDAVIDVAAPAGRRFVDKTLQNYLYCGFIRAALPRAKIILVRRHPMDNCYSLYKAHFQGKFGFSYALDELADYYLAFRRLARHWRSVLPDDAYLEISYDAIVRDQRAESRRLVDFLELPWEEDVLRFHESRAPSATASAVQIRRPLYDTAVGRWRHHAEALRPLHTRLAQEIPADELA